MTKKQKIPKRLIILDSGFRTRFLQDKKTGRLVGRTGRDTDFGKLPKTVIARIDRSPAASKVRRVKSSKGKFAESAGEIIGRAGIVKKYKRTSNKGKRYPVRKHRRKLKR